MEETKYLSDISDHILFYFLNHYKELETLWADCYQEQHEELSFGGKDNASIPALKKTFDYKLSISSEEVMMIRFVEEGSVLRLNKIKLISPTVKTNYIINLSNYKSSHIVDILYQLFSQEKLKSPISKYGRIISTNETVFNLIAEGKYYMLAKMIEQNQQQMSNSLYIMSVSEDKDVSSRTVVFGSILFQLLEKRKEYMEQNDIYRIAVIDKVIREYNLELLEQIVVESQTLKKRKTVNNGYGRISNQQAEQTTYKVARRTVENGELTEDALLHSIIINQIRKEKTK